MSKSLLTRFVDFLRGKAHKAMDSIENSIEILELKIRDLEQDYTKAVEGLAKVKALEIKYRNKANELKTSAAGYRQRALNIKSKIESGDWDETDGKADIIVMLNKEEQLTVEFNGMNTQADNQQSITENLAKKIKDMDKLIKTSKGQVTNLKAQKEASEVNKSVSKELSSVNFDGVASHVEEIEKQINQNNAEASAWEDLDTRLEDDEKRIERKLNESSPTSDSKLLDDFMNAK